MKFDETEIVAAGMIGFDMIEGPNVKWYKEFRDDIDLQIDMESFLMNFYLSFRGGDDELQPLAILYNGFYVTAFPRGLELCCLFMKPDNLNGQLNRLASIANELVNQMDEDEMDEEFSESEAENENQEEIKRIVINLLNNQEISTPELRRYFHLSNSEIWSIMSQLEREEKVIRTQKIGRSQYWTAILA
jgi:hypothetical protein